MKICSKCGIEKDLSNFAKNKITIDKLNCWCRECNKGYFADHYSKNSKEFNKKIIIHRNKRKDEFNQYIQDLNLKCQRCGFNHPAALDFHHRDPSQKDRNISDLKTAGVSLEKFRKELEKCDVLCSNCHRILHHEERL